MRRVGTQLRVLAIVYAGAFAVIAAASITGHLHGHGLVDLTRDPLAVAQAPWYLGFLSNLGVLAWWLTAVVCATAALVVSEAGGSSEDRRLLVAAAAVTAMLALDDLFQLHERFELPVYLFYAVVIAACARRRLHAIRATRWFTLAVAVVLLSASVVLDFGSEKLQLHVQTTAPEDLLKLFGIATWGTYFVRQSLRAITRAITHAAETGAWAHDQKTVARMIVRANARREFASR